MLNRNRKKEVWIDISKKRIFNILKKYRVCTKRQLETKISEAGPVNIRPEPIFIAQALNELTKKGAIISVDNPDTSTPTFYTFPSFRQNKEDQSRYEKLLALHKIYAKLAQNPNNCGKVLETVFYKSTKECKYFSTIGDPTTPPQSINGYDFNKINHPDFVLLYNSNTPAHSRPIKVIVECKNIRQWLYPEAHEIWEFLYKAAQTEMIPILITRKIAYPTRFLFQSIGAMGFEMHRQYFAPHLKDKMKNIIHKDELGFHNIFFSDEKESRIINFLDNVVRTQLEYILETFIAAKDSLLDFAEILSSSSLSPIKRKEIYYEAFLEFVRPEWKKDHMDYYPDL